MGKLRWKLGRPPGPGEGRLVVAVYALVTAGLVLSPFVTTGVPDPQGKLAPEFSLATWDGGTYRLATHLGSSPIFLEFMHPDCSHCQAVSPTLNSAYEAYGSQVVFVSVAIPLRSFDDPTAATVGAFRQTYEHGWTYCVATDDRVAKDYGISGTPTFFFISANGTIDSKHEGEIGLGPLAQTLQRIIGG
jgi:thiol-disulfide isomerase/thioredoxin